MRTLIRSAAAAVSTAVAVTAAGFGGAAQAIPLVGAPPRVPSIVPCSAGMLRATYTVVPGSNATGHVEYTLTVTNRSATRTCAFPAPLRLTLLGRAGQPLPTTQIVIPGRSYEVVLAPGQWAQALSELSPDLAGPGEPSHGNCEPTAHALRIGIGHATIRAPMDPTPVCQRGTLDFRRLKAVPLTPRCAPGALTGTFKRQARPFGGFAEYALTLRNASAVACHTDGIVGLRLLGAGGRKLATTVKAGVSSPVVIGRRVLETAVARVASGGGHCDAVATNLAITPVRGHGTLTAAAKPPVAACRHGLIQLTSLFGNG